MWMGFGALGRSDAAGRGGAAGLPSGFSRRKGDSDVEAWSSNVRYRSNNRMRDLHHPRIEEIALPDVLHALSDPVRLQIVRALAEREEQSCSSVEASVSKSTLSHHFKVLREAGVTHTRVNGTHRLVSIRRDELEERFPGLLDSVLGASRVETAEAV
jgi:DNA-binding transcriptional ArsR family regulator